MADLNLQNIKNPYKGVDPKQQLSGFQSWLDSVGLTNYQGKYQYQHDLASNMWDSENQYRDFDVQYNTPANQAFLQRQAGLNPDLNGVSGFEAGTAGNPMNSPQTLNQEIEEPLSRIASGLFEGIKMAMAVSNGFIDMRGKSIENTQKAFGTAEDIVKKLYGIGEKTGTPVWTIKGLSTIKNRRVRQDVEKILSSADDRSFDTSKYKAYGSYEGSRQDYLGMLGNPLYRQDDRDMIDAIRGYNEMYLDVEKIQTQFQELLAKYNISDLKSKEFYSLYDSDNAFRKSYNSFQRQIQSEMSKYFNNILGKDNLWTQIMLMSMFSSQTGAFNPISSGVDLMKNLVPNVGAKFLGGGFSVTHHR